jgi:DNA-binding transcriptional LysR family regulator
MGTLSDRKEMGAEIDVADLRCLSAAAEAANLEVAASAMGLDVLTLGRRIARLENSLGAPLFVDGGSGLRLTASGEAAMVYIRRILDEVEAMRAAGRPAERSRHRT